MAALIKEVTQTCSIFRDEQLQKEYDRIILNTWLMQEKQFELIFGKQIEEAKQSRLRKQEFHYQKTNSKGRNPYSNVLPKKQQKHLNQRLQVHRNSKFGGRR